MNLAPPIPFNLSDFLIGDPTIDEQHAALLSSINELYDARFRGEPLTTISHLISKLTDEAITHFADEEREMLAVGYIHYADHLSAHRRLLENALAFLARLERGEDVTAETQEFLFDWLKHHIRVADYDYVRYKRGLQEHEFTK